MDGCWSGPKIIARLRANRGHASGQQLRRVLVDTDGGIMHLLTSVDEILGQCEVCRTFDKAPRAPVAGAPTAPMFIERLLADLLPPDDLIALRAMDVFPEYSFLIPARTMYLQELWGIFCNSRIGVSGHPQSIQTGEGGDRRNEMWTDSCSGSRIKLQIQGVGARRRNSVGNFVGKWPYRREFIVVGSRTTVFLRNGSWRRFGRCSVAALPYWW